MHYFRLPPSQRQKIAADVSTYSSDDGAAQRSKAVLAGRVRDYMRTRYTGDDTRFVIVQVICFPPWGTDH